MSVRESIFKGMMDAMKELQKREIQANAVFISDPLFFSRITTYPGEVPMVCGLSAYYDAGLPDDVLFAVTRVERENNWEKVRHERWEWGYRNGQYGIYCTGCGAGWVDSATAEWIAHEHDYCPKCGAKMDRRADADG